MRGAAFLLLLRAVAGDEALDTALLNAAGDGDLVQVERHLAAGANVNARSKTGGESPLHLAAIKCEKPVIAALLAAGADPSAVTQAGDAMSMTVLHWFVNMNGCDSEALRMLLAADPDPDVENTAGQTAWDMLARLETDGELAETLQRKQHSFEFWLDDRRRAKLKSG